jgi:ankyrin repeat protein
MYAASDNPDPAVISALLNAGADGAAKDHMGKTAFDYAVSGNEELQGTEAFVALQKSAQGK